MHSLTSVCLCLTFPQDQLADSGCDICHAGNCTSIGLGAEHRVAQNHSTCLPLNMLQPSQGLENRIEITGYQATKALPKARLHIGAVDGLHLRFGPHLHAVPHLTAPEASEKTVGVGKTLEGLASVCLRTSGAKDGHFFCFFSVRRRGKKKKKKRKKRQGGFSLLTPVSSQKSGISRASTVPVASSPRWFWSRCAEQTSCQNHMSGRMADMYQVPST